VAEGSESSGTQLPASADRLRRPLSVRVRRTWNRAGIEGLIREEFNVVSFVRGWSSSTSTGLSSARSRSRLSRLGVRLPRFPELGSRDRVCELIGKKVAAVSVVDDVTISISFTEWSAEMKKQASLVAAILFWLIALAQLLRVLFRLEVTAGGVNIPLWVSILATVILGTLGIWLWRERRE
jgi:hypothetical protein